MKNKIKEIVLLAKDKGFVSGISNIHEAYKVSDGNVTKDLLNYLLLAEMQKWLRENHSIYCEIKSVNYINRIRFESCIFSEIHEDEYTDDIDDKDVFDTYELALVDALKVALKDLKINKK